MTTTRDQLRLRAGGLMRCCVDSFAQWVAANPKGATQPGERIMCVHEKQDTMHVNDRGDCAQWIGPAPTLYAVGKK